MCGIVGLCYANEKQNVIQGLIDALTVLQHRGQDAAGIVASNHGNLSLRKGLGTVAEVFTQKTVENVHGNIGLGHVRYPTAGGRKGCSSEAQPLYTNYPYGIALAHNGNLTNTEDLAESVKQSYRQVNTTSDSELLLNSFANELAKKDLTNLSAVDIFDAVRSLMGNLLGGYSVVMLINGKGLLAFRDPHGIRPLCFGSRSNSDGSTDYCIASESVALDALAPSFFLTRDVSPGEAIFVSSETGIGGTPVLTAEQCCSPPLRFTPCLFEYVYFARPDTILDGVQVYEARSRMGDKLARRILALRSGTAKALDIDVVIPIPETSRTAALTCAQLLGRPYREGFVKNRYIARTFIMPGQAMRKKTVRLKLNTIKSEFRDKVVLLVDDSIVRGTTSVELVQMARDAGAKKVYFASAAPPVRFPNVYGIDMPTKSELIASGRSVEQVCALIGADWLVYNNLNDVMEAVRECNPGAPITEFDASCFDGRYVTSDVTPEYLGALEKARGKGRVDAVVQTVPTTVSVGDRIDKQHVGGAAGSGLVSHEELRISLFMAESDIPEFPSVACETLHNQSGK